MLNAIIFSFTILNLVKKDILDFHVTTATDICTRVYERSNSQLFSQSTLNENHGNTKSINFNYHCPTCSQQNSFSTILSYHIPLDIVQDSTIQAICSSFHITYPAISYRSLQYRQSVVPFIDSSGCQEVFLKNVADLTGKHLYRSLFFHKVACLSPEALLKIRHSNKGVTILTYVHGALRSFFVDYIKGKF